MTKSVILTFYELIIFGNHFNQGWAPPVSKKKIYKNRAIRIGKCDEIRFILENRSRVHKTNPIGVKKGEVPPLKILIKNNILREFVKEILGAATFWLRIGAFKDRTATIFLRKQTKNLLNEGR